ncbi:MAG: serine/threonine protein kinase [Pseudomonadota bacterium]|nr:serine/threonine protein kinase [Pseudomonadota bacterium]
MDATPYATLVPDLILDAVESVGYCCSGSLLVLNSYENRVYQIGIENDAPLIAKFYRPQRWTDDAILEEHQFALELASHEIPVIAPLEINSKTLHEHGGFRFALFPRKGGHALEIDNMTQLEQMGRFIGRLHAVGSCQPFQHRMRIDVETYGYQPYRYLMERNFIPPDLKHNFSLAAETALAQVDEHLQRAGDLHTIRLHGDCHSGNVLWNEKMLHIVDLDDCLMGPAIQDLWMMLSGSEQETEIQLKHLLNGYKEFYDFDLRELRLIEAFRTLRMMNYAGWLAKRWDDPAFPIHFPWANTPRYWEKQLENLREQIAIMAEQSF